MNNVNNFVVLCCFIVQCYRRFSCDTDGVFRIALDAARSKTLVDIEAIFFEYIKANHESIWKHVMLNQKYIPVYNIDGKVQVASEVLIDKSLITKHEISLLHTELFSLVNNIYCIDYNNDINNNNIDYSLVDDAVKKEIEVYAESVLRKKGDSSTRYNHQIILGDASAIVQHYLPKPDSLPGNPDRTLISKVCGVLSDEREHSVRLVNEEGKKEYFEYSRDDFDKIFTTAICKKHPMKVVTRQLIDDNKRLYWEVMSASKI